MRNYKNIPSGLPLLAVNCWFSHNVIKIQYRELSILLSCYLQEGLEQLKTHFHANFHPERALCFAIQYA